MEAKRNKGGAPKKEDADRKDRIVRVLFNDQEFDKLVERKATTKAKNLSVFIRTICLDKPLRVKPQLTTHQENVLSLVREIRSDFLRMGVNINQSSKRINSMTDYHDLQREVRSMASVMAEIESQLHTLVTVVIGSEGFSNSPTNCTDGYANQ